MVENSPNRFSRISTVAVAWIVSNLLWALIGPGIGIAVGAVLTGLIEIGQPWRSFFFVGVSMVGTGLALGVVRPLLEPRLPKRKGPTIGQFLAATKPERERERKEARIEERKRLNRVALHEAITTLEQHKTELERFGRSEVPTYQGQWPENRDELEMEARYDLAVRATERAFQAIPLHYPPDRSALGPIDQALAELESALKDE